MHLYADREMYLSPGYILLSHGESNMTTAFNLIFAIETYGKPITVKELARIIGTSIDTIYRAARRGTYPYYRRGGIIVFDPSTLGLHLRRLYPPMAHAANVLSDRINTERLKGGGGGI